MVKRSLSVLLTVLMTLSLIMVPAMGVSANVEKVDITDYTPVKPAGLTLGTMGRAEGYGITLDQSANTGWQWRAIAASSRDTGAPSAFMTPYGGAYWGITSGITKDTTYVISFQVRNKSAEGVTPNAVFGLLDGAQGGPAAGYQWLGQYTWAENVTSSEWTTIEKTVTLAYDGTANTRFVLGLGNGNTHATYSGKENMEFRPNAGLDMLPSSIYIAPEAAYDVVNTISMTKVMPGAVVSGSAKVVNQIGTKGNLNQDITYFVTDTEGNVVEGVSVVAGTNGSYTATVDANAADGDYVITARAAAYNTTENFMQQSVTLTVEDVDYSDASVAPVTANLGTMTKLTDYNGANYDYGTTLTESGDYYIFTNKTSQVKVPSTIARPAGGVEWKLTEGLKGDTYLMTFRVKKNGDTAENPNIVYGFGDGAMGGSAQSYAWLTQTYYVQDITSTEWQTIVQEITLPCNTTGSTVVTLGLGVGNTQGEWAKREGDDFRPGVSAIVDMSSFAVYKSGGSRVNNEAITSANVFAGQTIEAKAEVVNSVGTKGTLDQTMEYIVLDSATRKKMTTDITIEVGEDGNYTINVGEDAAAGEYVAVASNTTNGATLRTGLEFTVEDLDKYLADTDPNETDAATLGNMGNGKGYGINVVSDATTNWKYRATATESREDSLIPSAVAKPTAGLIWNIPTGTITKDTTYVFSIKVKNTSPEGITPNAVFGFIDGAQGGPAAGYQWLGQYVWAQEITEADEWTTITQRVTFAYDGTSATQIVVGLGTGCTYASYNGKENFDFRPGAVLDIDNTSIYFAPEAVYDVEVAAEKNIVRAGSSVIVDAKAVNQIGLEGDLAQNFSWAVLNSARTGVAEGVKVTPANGDSSEAKVTFASDVEEGTYVIVAYSEDYEMVNSVEITVSNTTSVENVAVDTANKTVTFDAVNVAADGMNGAVYVAEYVPGADTFVKAEKVPFALAAGDTRAKEVEYTLEIAEGNELRVYIWDNNLTPYIQPVSKKDN